MKLPIKYLSNYPRKTPPVGYAHQGDAGFDLRAALDGPTLVCAGSRTTIPTGIAVAVPAGYELQIRPRSGLAVQSGLTVLNAPGTIDAGYRGEIAVVLINHGSKHYSIQPGDRIAQAVLAPVAYADFVPVEELPESERGARGCGSTGVA